MKSAAQVGEDLASWASCSETVTYDERSKASLTQKIPGYNNSKLKLAKRQLLDNGEGKIVDKICRNKNVTGRKPSTSSDPTTCPKQASPKRQ